MMDSGLVKGFVEVWGELDWASVKGVLTDSVVGIGIMGELLMVSGMVCGMISGESSRNVYFSVEVGWIVPYGNTVSSKLKKKKGREEMVDSESTHGSNVDISNIHECKQTLVSVVAKKVDISETSVEVDSKLISKMTVGKSIFVIVTNISMEKIKLFQKSSAKVNYLLLMTSVKRQQEPDSTSSTSTLATTVSADGNFDL
ncbi:hypothetical protein Tco_0524405 [Tanacetum coccineum]